MYSIELSKNRHGTSEPNKLTLRFTEDMKLPSQIALSKISLWHNWNNISSKLGDYSFKLQINNVGGPKAQEFYRENRAYYDVNNNFIKVPDGSYSVADLNNFIHLQMNRIEKKANLFRNFGINLFANPTYNRITVEIEPFYTLTLSRDLANLVGSENTEITGTRRNLELVPKIENVEEIIVHCDLVRNTFQPEIGLLYSFSPTSTIGHYEAPQIYYPIWKLTRSATVREVNVWLTNQDNKPLDFEDNWTVSILLKPESI